MATISVPVPEDETAQVAGAPGTTGSVLTYMDPKTNKSVTVPVPAGTTVKFAKPTPTPKLTPITDPTPTYTGGTAATPAAANTPDSTGKSVQDVVASNYGYLSAFLNDPVIGPVLTEAASKGLDEAGLEGLIFDDPAAKSWWTHTTQSARQWDADQQLDPATNATKVANQAATVQGLAGKSGITISPATAKQIATQSLRLGWSTDLLQQAVAAQFHYNPNKTGGVNSTTATLTQTAKEYGVPLSDSSIQSWSDKILGQNASPDDFKAYVEQQAKSLYPTIAGQIDQGLSTATIFDPYAQIASQQLGLDASSIDFTQPKWQKALMNTAPDGTRAPMTLDQWTSTIKNDPTYGWGNTVEAQNQAGAFGKQLANAAGF